MLQVRNSLFDNWFDKLKAVEYVGFRVNVNVLENLWRSAMVAKDK